MVHSLLVSSSAIEERVKYVYPVTDAQIYKCQISRGVKRSERFNLFKKLCIWNVIEIHVSTGEVFI